MEKVVSNRSSTKCQDSNTQTRSGWSYKLQIKCNLTRKEGSSVNIYVKFQELTQEILNLGGICLVPFNPSDVGPDIFHTRDLTQDEKEFKKYCYDSNIPLSGNSLYYLHKIRTANKPLHKVKAHLLPWLSEHDTFINKTKLNTGRNCIIGWLKGTSPYYRIKNLFRKISNFI